MKRGQFIQYLLTLPILGGIMQLKDLYPISQKLDSTPRMPVLFLGHGSPMNAIEENEFVQGFRTIAQTLPQPTAILCISAHWETKGTLVTAMEKPPTIHDFGGFPDALFAVQYPAPGSPEWAKQTQSAITSTTVGLDYTWGLDHGCWSVVKHLYPNADVPTLQMSLDYTKPPLYHYELAKQLASLRRKGVLIVGSGNMVHNLNILAWDKLNADNYGYDWAIEAAQKMKQYLQNRQHESLINYQQQGKAFQLAIPTPEHYLPLLYTIALQEEDESISLYNDKAVAGSLTMTSVKIS